MVHVDRSEINDDLEMLYCPLAVSIVLANVVEVQMIRVDMYTVQK